MTDLLPVSRLLSGPTAFYNQSDYEETTRSELAQKSAVPVTYTWNSEHIILRIVKIALSIIIFPIGIYQVIHGLAGLAIVPASLYGIVDGRKIFDDQRQQLDLNGELKYKRITVQVDGYSIDAMIVGTAATLNNGRWVLGSAGNGDIYEANVDSGSTFTHILAKLDANGIFFNYPAVGASSGLLPNRNAMTKAYRAMLNLLEDKEKGIGAKEIIGFGHSLGGAVMADAIEQHSLKKDIKYVFTARQTFSNLSDTATNLTGSKILGLLVKIFGWNMSPVSSFKKVDAPQVILQTANVYFNEMATAVSDDFFTKTLINSFKKAHGGNISLDAETILQHYEKNGVLFDLQISREKLLEKIDTILKEAIQNDGVIAKEVSLANALLNDPACDRTKRRFIGIPDWHNGNLRNTNYLVETIKELLKP